jgi:hypothetical protein
MIVTENRKKVKKISMNLINNIKSKVSVPTKKFILEMSFGMLTSGSSNITLIAGMLKESIKVKDTLKRLQRMLLNSNLLESANSLSISESKKRINSETILALDGGDISHQYGKKFEYQSTVKDGSKNKLSPGYWLNQISGYNPSKSETFPIALDMYSTKKDGFESANKESFKIMNSVVSTIGTKGLWVMDRGYDSGKIFYYFLNKSLNFIVRMTKQRHLKYKGQFVPITELGKKINRRNKFNKHSNFGKLKVTLCIENQEHTMTLICYKDNRNKEPILFLTNGYIKSSKELKRRIRGYFHRWGVEVCYRFEKQSFGIEKSKTRNFKRIKTLLGLTIISWLIMLRINDNAKLREELLIAARMEKTKLKNRPKFIYYRLHRGIQNLFEGIKRMFNFRIKKKKVYNSLYRSLFKTDDFELTMRTDIA